jgi:hypothetical protein
MLRITISYLNKSNLFGSFSLLCYLLLNSLYESLLLGTLLIFQTECFVLKISRELHNHDLPIIRMKKNWLSEQTCSSTVAKTLPSSN